MKLPVNYDKIHYSERRVIREEYIKRQKGLCYHCKASLSGPPAQYIQDTWVNKGLFPKNFFKYPIHLHHNHDTGMTIGAIHNKCNAVLWQYYGE